MTFVPDHNLDRLNSGKSTVTYKEIFNSIKGILLLFIYKKD